jgi:hypothetical protein
VLASPTAFAALERNPSSIAAQLAACLGLPAVVNITALTHLLTVEFEAAVDTLEAERFDTALGNVKSDNKGDVTAPGYVFKMESNGKYDYAN